MTCLDRFIQGVIRRELHWALIGLCRLRDTGAHRDTGWLTGHGPLTDSRPFTNLTGIILHVVNLAAAAPAEQRVRGRVRMTAILNILQGLVTRPPS